MALHPQPHLPFCQFVCTFSGNQILAFYVTCCDPAGIACVLFFSDLKNATENAKMVAIKHVSN